MTSKLVNENWSSLFSLISFQSLYYFLVDSRLSSYEFKGYLKRQTCFVTTFLFFFVFFFFLIMNCFKENHTTSIHYVMINTHQNISCDILHFQYLNFLITFFFLYIIIIKFVFCFFNSGWGSFFMFYT